MDGLIYHGSGNGAPYNDPSGQIYEAINPDTLVITPRTISGELDDFFELSALTYLAPRNTFLAATIDEYLFKISSTGAVGMLGDMDHVSKGLAVGCGAEDLKVPTLSEWGLIALAGVLGIIGLLAIRRRKATA